MNIKLEVTGNTFINVSGAYCGDSAITISGFYFDNMTIEGNAVLEDGANALNSTIIWISNGISNDLYSKEQIDAAFIPATAAVSSYSEMLDATSDIKTDETIVLMDDISVDAP